MKLWKIDDKKIPVCLSHHNHVTAFKWLKFWWVVNGQIAHAKEKKQKYIRKCGDGLKVGWALPHPPHPSVFVVFSCCVGKRYGSVHNDTICQMTRLCQFTTWHLGLESRAGSILQESCESSASACPFIDVTQQGGAALSVAGLHFTWQLQSYHLWNFTYVCRWFLCNVDSVNSNTVWI